MFRHAGGEGPHRVLDIYPIYISQTLVNRVIT